MKTSSRTSKMFAARLTLAHRRDGLAKITDRRIGTELGTLMQLSLGRLEQLMPPRLRQRLFDEAQTADCLTAANRFCDWFDNSGTPFFRYYTDHSAEHSLEVFGTACDYISDASYDAVSGQDLIVLLLASFCHDSGMHITERQFFSLIEQSHNSTYSTLDSKSWPALWADFLEEAKRFNQKTLLEIFGDSQPVNEPPLIINDLTDRDRLLIGEFLRRHHPRFCHELVLGLDIKLGLPNLMHEFSRSQRDVVGLISRSHGMELRACAQFAKDNFDLRDFNRTHIVFDMALLRISDYAQIQPTRAPDIKSKIH